MESDRDLIVIFESITDAFFSLDREWRFTYLNSEAVGTRFHREYHNIFEYIHPDDRQKTYAALVKAISGSSFHGPVEYRFRHKDGTWRYLETSGYNLLEDPWAKRVS